MRLRQVVVPLTVLACALGFLPASLPASKEKRPLPTLAVIGASRTFDDKGWEDARIGYGIRQLLSEALYGTDGFAVVEEKEEVRKRIDDFAEAVWALGGAADTAARFEALADSIAADRIVWCVVESFSIPHAELEAGPFHKAKETTLVNVRIHLKNTQTGKIIEEVGVGKSRRALLSTLFSFREKTKGGMVDFDKTAVGHATREAIEAAIKTLKNKGWFD